MKITSNSFGNYNPIYNNKVNNNQKVIQKNENPIEITKEEKKFFTDLYPNEKEQIEGYHFYQRNGTKSGVALGLLFDKRG